MLNDVRVASACLYVRTCQKQKRKREKETEKESETAKILQLYATSIFQVHSFVCQLDYELEWPDGHMECPFLLI